MSSMISVASGFQYSVNIAYDLNNDDKIENFIPTASSIQLLEDILLSTRIDATDRARLLIGAYGKGKSHIMLMILSMLQKRELSLFEKTLAKIKGTKLEQAINNYYDSKEKILPIIVTGSNTSLTQAFLLALQRTLSDNNLEDVMPATNYEAAIRTINKWEKDYPSTFQQFAESISIPVKDFVNRLGDYDIECYEAFERIYPSLTAGSVFNPFLGFDVVELYENTAKGLKSKGYTGIFVVYDEFSKYLEANINAASVSDTKMLQDFAEKCNRSGSLQMHLMLISHKEISNYIDVLPKSKVDGWRGVSERFLHVHLSNNFTQTYEIIGSVIKKDPTKWKSFLQNYRNDFEALETRYSEHQLFSEMNSDAIADTIRACYPLHPVSTFVLPRLSERVAQNERTLFTFLSAKGKETLSAFLDQYDDDGFNLITPDQVYDYFAPLLKKEVYSGMLHDTFVLAECILEKLNPDSLESRIVKTIALVYLLEQFEKLRPTKEELYGIFSVGCDLEAVNSALDYLIEKEYVIYLKRSNGFLQLKQSSGVDIQQKISDEVEHQKSRLSLEDALNESNADNYVYPSRYNDQREMTRYFAFVFADQTRLTHSNTIHEILPENADGTIVGIIPSSSESIPDINKTILDVSKQFDRVVFAIPKKYHDVEKSVREYRAVCELRDQAVDDRVLFDEYEVVYEDLRDLITAHIGEYTHPEVLSADYIFSGKRYDIRRKAALTALLSDICDAVYSDTPVINNEALNRQFATSIAKNSRNKVVAGLLRSELEPNLGLNGTGQEVSIMRSTLMRTGILSIDSGITQLNLHPKDHPLISNMMGVIENFIMKARTGGAQSFASLYDDLCSRRSRIALRQELVPIFLAAALHKYKQDVVINDRFGQIPLNADAVNLINAKPENYNLEYLDWDHDKAAFIVRLEDVLDDVVKEAEKGANPYEHIITAMKRWYLSLPKYTKDMRKTADGKALDNGYAGFMKLLRSNPTGHEFLFKDLPLAFGYESFVPGLADNIQASKQYFDNAILDLRNALKKEVRDLFVDKRAKVNERMSLASIIRDWCDGLDPSVFEQVFQDGTEKCLALLRSVTNDEDVFVCRLAKVIVGLRIEDWDDETIHRFRNGLVKCKETAESFTSKGSASAGDSNINASEYEVVFVGDNGETEIKRFEKTETGGKAALLYNKLTADLNSFGQAVSEAEKRQILINVLKELC